MRIADVMTRQPWTVQIEDSISVARHVLAEREIRQLPVLDGAGLIGVVGERELAQAVDQLGTVGDVMLPVPGAPATQPLDEVLEAMVEHHWGAVVVTDDDVVVGIFTAADAIRLLREALRPRRRRALVSEQTAGRRARRE